MHLTKGRVILYAGATLILTGWAIISLVMVFRNTSAALGANDLYTYWYSGHFIRKGIDPYQAFQDNRIPDLPVQYIDGIATKTEDIVIKDLVPAPGYTFPFLLFFTPFAFFSWTTAKWLWLILNIGLTIILPLAAYQFLEKEYRPSPWVILLTCLVTLGLTSTRYALSSGQVTMLVLTLMILSLILSQKHPRWAGVFLGLALSKYSISAGLLLYFIFIKRDVRVVLSALLVQILGLISLIWISGTNLRNALQGYTMMFSHHAPMDGIHLGSLVPSTSIWMDITAAIGITVLAIFPFWLLRKYVEHPHHSLIVFCAYLAWSLLVAYHRLYDTVGLIFFYCLMLSIIFRNETWRLKRAQVKFVGFITFSTLLILLVPAGSLVRSALPGDFSSFWINLAGRLTTFIIVASIGIAFWLLMKTSNEKHLTQRTQLNVG